MKRSRTWLLIAACVVTFLGIGLWTKGAKKEVKKESLTKVAVSPQVETREEPQQEVTKNVVSRKPVEKPEC